MYLLPYLSALAGPQETSALITPGRKSIDTRVRDSSSLPVYPKVKETPQILGLVNDPALNRDSCGSARVGYRTLWTCRDTQLYNVNGSVDTSLLITSTASWTDLTAAGSPALSASSYGSTPLRTTILQQYGNNSKTQAYFPLQPDECEAPAGGCPDGTRFAICETASISSCETLTDILGPDLPPLVTQDTMDGPTIAYTWIRKSHITQNLGTLVTNPAASLYRISYEQHTNSLTAVLPAVAMIEEEFWAENEVAFGNYGNLIRDGTAYLYGQANGSVYLARVPAMEIENKSAYQYWVDNAWTDERPKIGQAGAKLANASAGGQGTYYYSNIWNSFVWIGGTDTPGANFYITTAPNATGPWIEPFQFYTGVNGNYSLGAYSIQAHPDLQADPASNSIYVTYTKNDLNAAGINVYTTPLIYVEWEP